LFISIDPGMCSPAIVFFILKISHVSIDSGKTHQKSPAHSLVFRGFFCKMYLADFQDWLYHKVHLSMSIPSSKLGLPTPSPASKCGGDPSDDWRKSLAFCLLCGLSKIREKYIKKGIRNCPRLSMYTTGIEKKSNMSHPGIKFLTPVAT
jgi:hypothetical protein